MCGITFNGLSEHGTVYGKLGRIPPNLSGARPHLKHRPSAKPRALLPVLASLVRTGMDTPVRESEVAGSRRFIWLPLVTDVYEEPRPCAKLLIG